nr:hypothetical protein FYQYKPKK_FYQYKPKK_CDS_0009 [Microvirus sp.]
MVTTAKIRAREKARGKKAYTAVDSAGNLHYAFDQPTLSSILTKANNNISSAASAKAYQQDIARSDYNNAFNSAQVKQQMDFQERMSSTAHQREVKDLLAAGLNPILSANGGASAPAGASATSDNSTATLKAQQAINRENIAASKYQAELNAGIQLEMNKQNIASAQKMARWQNALNRELGYAQMANNADIANIGAGASMYAANMSSSASRYGSDVSAAASKYGVDNPNDPFMYIVKDIFNNDGKKTAKLFDSLKGAAKKGVRSGVVKKSNKHAKKKYPAGSAK